MQRGILAFGCTAGLAGLLLAGVAHAQTWEIIDGRVKGSDQRLSGFVTSSGQILPELGEPPLAISVDDFEVDAGKRSYTESRPLAYHGYEAIPGLVNGTFLFDGDRIEWFSLRSGGDVVFGGDALFGVRRNEIAFRILEFSAVDGEVVSRDGDTLLPRRMRVSGKLDDRTEYWSVPPFCPPFRMFPLSSPAPGGGLVVLQQYAGSGGVIIGTQILRGGIPYNSSYGGHPLSIDGSEVDDCDWLRPGRRVTRTLRKFSMVLSTALPMKIDVLPGNKRNRVDPGTDLVVAVALLGSRQLDVRDIDRESLRLGRGEAEPQSIFPPASGGFGRVQFLWDENDDSHPDLVAKFAVSEAELAFGDTELCLLAKTMAGETYEGCDAVDTRPRALSQR